MNVEQVKSQKGLVLVIVLLFIFLLSLLVLMAMEIAIVQTKLSQNDHSQHYTFEAAEAGLIQAEASLNQDKPHQCILTKPLTNLSEQKADWWQQQCHGSFPKAKIYYSVE